VDALQLNRPPPGQFLIQVLAGASERLPRALSFGPQFFAVGASGLF
jgi:hypothetical protein